MLPYGKALAYGLSFNNLLAITFLRRGQLFIGNSLYSINLRFQKTTNFTKNQNKKKQQTTTKTTVGIFRKRFYEYPKIAWRSIFTSWDANCNYQIYFYFDLTKSTKLGVFKTATLREKCPYSEFFWSVFSRIRTEYGPG